MKRLSLYQLKGPDLPWDDYGDVLIHGMARSKRGILELYRTGPFVPPISRPSRMVVVTAAFLRDLQDSKLKGIDFGPVKKKHIPKIDWRAWKPYGTQEMKYPAGGEPENYLLRKHSPEAATALSELWAHRYPGGRLAHRRDTVFLVRDPNGYALVFDRGSGRVAL